MDINIYTPADSDMGSSDAGTADSKSDGISQTNTAVSTPLGSPTFLNTNSNPLISKGDVNTPVPGWPALARMIANKSAFEAFPSFTDLNVKSLLYYQAELILLRKKLHEEEFKDHYNPTEQKQIRFAENLDYLIACGKRTPKPKQWELIEQIRTVLEKYNAALIQFSQVSEFPNADSVNVDSLKECAKKVCSDGDGIKGSGSKIWGTLGQKKEEKKNDKGFWKLFLGLLVGLFKSQEDARPTIPNEFQEHLIVPHPGHKSDGLTLWVAHSFIPFFHYVWQSLNEPTWEKFGKGVRSQLSSCKSQLPRFREKNPSIATTTGTSGSGGSNSSDVGEKNLTAYSNNWIVRVTSILTTIVACLLPIVAIVVLSRVHTMGMILGLIALFNTIFAFGLVLISSTSSRVEIFTATAAFSAVMVVFVQNKISQN